MILQVTYKYDDDDIAGNKIKTKLLKKLFQYKKRTYHYHVLRQGEGALKFANSGIEVLRFFYATLYQERAHVKVLVSLKTGFFL